MASVAVNPPHAAVRISASVIACVEVVCAVAGDVDFVTTPNAGRIAMEFKHRGFRPGIAAEVQPKVGVKVAVLCNIEAVADACHATEFIGIIEQVWFFGVVVPYVNAELFSGKSAVTSHDVVVEALDVAEFEVSAFDDRTFLEVAEVFTGLCVEHLDLVIVIYAI